MKNFPGLAPTFKGWVNKMNAIKKLKVLRSSEPSFEKRLKDILSGEEQITSKAEPTVKAILRAVREEGDHALFNFTEKYDRIRLDSHSVMVSPEEIENAYNTLDSKEINALNTAANRIKKYHQEQMDCVPMCMEKRKNVSQVLRPLKRVGLYVPGGKATYPSSVLMGAIPAAVAGVNEIIMVSPTVSPQVLAAARIAGVNSIYRIGGAQAVAALAYGTESIPKVDKIVGPGNVYVETAKRMLYGEVGLDMVAGPSEVLIITDDNGVASFVAADLLAQAEHDEDAVPILIATSEDFIREVEKELSVQLKALKRGEIAAKSIERKGIMILAADIREAAEITNKIAPEHLVLMVKEPDKLLDMISCAGAVFLGNYSPVAVGDYLAGPSHVLPTGGTARFFSPLGVEDFIKRMSVISFSKEELSELGDTVQSLALIEGLDAHARAVECRLKRKE
jgi:histidinol dehydrogenase